MEVFGHNDVADDDELITPANPLPDSEEEVSSTYATQQRETVIATAGDEVKIAAAVVSLQTPGHREEYRSLKPAPCSYLGLIPREYSSGGRPKLGSISKQGNRFLRMLLVEAAHSVCRYDEGFRKQYLHRCHGKPKGVAKVAAARKLALRLYWMLRTHTAYPEIVRIESSSRVPLAGAS
jgi:hypothetical protein